MRPRKKPAGAMPHGVARAFAPSHMTGFFALGKGTSYGAGITLSKGTETSCTAKPASSGVSYYVNGRKARQAQLRVSACAVSKYRKLFPEFFRENGLEVRHSHAFPAGFGLGTSACAALSLSLALNGLLGSPLSREKAVAIAAEADLECKCGVLGVAASAEGGFLAKSSPESAISRLGLPKGCAIMVGLLSPISTSRVLSDRKTLARLGSEGKRAAASFFREPTIYSLARVSNSFALGSGIAKGKAKKFLLAERQCGMAMLGNTLFWVFPDMQSALLARRHHAKSFREIHVCVPEAEGARLI
ncbi:MAG: hypothetical protein WC506_05230 [Candidatus Micrarchaeia archaeon]